MDILDIISTGFATGQDFELVIDYNNTRPVITTTYPIDFSGTRHLNFGKTKVTKDFVFRAESVVSGRSGIRSSNVFIMRYFYNMEILRITFRNGARYEYMNISAAEWNLIKTGWASPITTGENEYGKWDPQKFPSVGAAVHKYLINKGNKGRKL